MYQEIFKLHTDFLKAIAHPKRLEIVHLLRDQTLTVSAIQTMLDLPQGNLSQHLQVLRHYRVVQTTKKGKQIYYRVADPRIISACDLIREVLIEHSSTSPKVKNELSSCLSDLVPAYIDPICGMKLSKKTAAFSLKDKAGTHYFCASGCLKSYKRDKI